MKNTHDKQKFVCWHLENFQTNCKANCDATKIKIEKTFP